MRYDLLPLPNGEGFVLRLETPSQPSTELAIEEFFRECAWTLTWQEEQGHGILGIVIGLSSVQELVPASPYLLALYKFMGEHPFAVVCGHDYRERLRLVIGVLPNDSDDEDHHSAASAADSSTRSNAVKEIYAAATSGICCALWHNEQIRATRYVAMNVPFVPSQELVNQLVGSSRSNEGEVELPPLRCGKALFVTVVVENHDAEERDILQVELPGNLGLCAVGVDNAAMLMDRILNVFGGMDGNDDDTYVPAARRRRKASVIMGSQPVADAVASCLREHGTHSSSVLRTVRLVAATGSNLDDLLPQVDSFRGPYLDGTSLCTAAMSISSVACLVVAGFRLQGDLSESEDVVSSEADGCDPPKDAARLLSIAIEECEILDDPVRGPGAFFTSLLSRARSLQELNLLGTRVPPPAMAALCRTLAAASLKVLQLGRCTMQRENCLDDEAVEVFFRAFPTLKSLRFLMFNHYVGPHQSRTVLDGVKDNYWIGQMLVQSFRKDLNQGEDDEDDDDDDDRRTAWASPNEELSCYLWANTGGRRAAVYDAVMTLQETTSSSAHGDFNNQDARTSVDAKLGLALRALEDFASMVEYMKGLTCLYLCVRLFVPAALGGGCSGGVQSSPECNGSIF